MILHAYYYCGVKKSKVLGMIPATLQSNFFTICVSFLRILFSKSFGNKQRPGVERDVITITISFAARGRLVLTHTRAQSIYP